LTDDKSKESSKDSKSKKSSKVEEPKPKKSKTSSSEKVVKTDGTQDWESTEPIPKRNKNGVLIFPDFKDFTPNLTPKEILQVKEIKYNEKFDI
jgi:hypothetical protein